MKFVIPTQEFNQFINKIQNMAAQKNTLPILNNVLIQAANNKVILTATDLTVGIRCTLDAKVLEEGATTLPAKKLGQLTRELTAPNMEISTNAGDITEIIANTSRFKLHGMNSSEFPSLPDVSGAVQIKVKQDLLKEMLNKTSFAVSNDDNRYILTGLHMNVDHNQITFEATDGKRMARAYISLESNEQGHTGSYVIPLKAVQEISIILGDSGDAVLYLLHDKIAVESGNSFVVAKLLSGEYPDVTKVIPDKAEFLISLHREELTSLLRQISLFTADASHSVRFSFTNGDLRLSANTTQVGEGKVNMPVNYHGEPLDVAFNPGFFLDILRHTKDETVNLGIIDAYNPGVITQPVSAEATARPNPIFVIMPMRLCEE